MHHTPLYHEHLAAGGKIVDFNGWALPVQYAGIVDEHLHTRTACSIFDCSHMGEFTVKGTQAIAAYNNLVISNVEKVKVGRARYGALLNERGGFVDDAITFRMAEDELYVVTNAGALDDVSKLFCGAHEDINDVTFDTAKIDVQGPQSRDVLQTIGMDAAAHLKYFNLCRTSWHGAEIILSRTGYTGELGYEIFVPNDLAVALWKELLAQPNVQPAGLGARDTLRTEVGYLLSGQDMGPETSPLSAGLEPFIDFAGEFIGKDAVVNQREAGGYPVIAGFKTGSRRAPRHDMDLKHGGETVGVVTSGTFAPSLGHGIGLGYMPPHLAAPGTVLQAGPRDLDVTVTEMPFYTEGTCRA